MLNGNTLCETNGNGMAHILTNYVGYFQETAEIQLEAKTALTRISCSGDTLVLSGVATGRFVYVYTLQVNGTWPLTQSINLP